MKIICLNEIRIGIFPWMDCYRTIAQLQRMGIILKFPLYVLGTWPFRACEIRPPCLFILLFSFICNASSLVVNRYLRILRSTPLQNNPITRPAKEAENILTYPPDQTAYTACERRLQCGKQRFSQFASSLGPTHTEQMLQRFCLYLSLGER